MSYSFDTDGWELFSTPFSTSPVRTAPTPPKQQAERQQQRPSAVQQSKPAPVTTAPAPDEKPAPAIQANTAKPEPASLSKASVPASTPPVAPKKELVLDMTSGSGTAPAQDDTQKRKAHEESEAKRKAEWEAKQAAKKQAKEAALAEPNISNSFIHYICEIQQEAEWNYMLVSHDLHENESYLNGMDKKTGKGDLI